MNLLPKTVIICLSLVVISSTSLFAQDEKQSTGDIIEQALRVAKALEAIDRKPEAAISSIEKSEQQNKEKKEIYIAEGYVPHEPQDESQNLARNTVDELFNQAIELRDNGHNEKSIELLRGVIKLEPSFQRARLILARELVISEQYDSVERLLLPLLHKSNDDWAPWFLVGTAQLMLGELDLAAYSLDKSLSETGRYQAAVWVQRAVVEQQRNKPQNALQLLRVAAEIAPDDPQIDINLAYSYEALGEDESSAHHYQRFLESPLGTEKNNILRLRVVKHLAKRSQADAVIQ